MTLRPTIAADLAGWEGERLPHRIRAITALAGDEVIGIGGIGYRPEGTVVAFVDMKPEARRYPVAIHRAGRMAMEMIRASGAPLVVAEAQAGNAAAERWLLRLGFRAVETAAGKAFVWQRGTHGN